MTTNNLPTLISQNTGLALKKTKALFELTDRLLAKKPRELMIPEDESWMERLWAWADEQHIPEYAIDDDYFPIDTHIIFPRSKHNLVMTDNISILSDYWGELTFLHDDIGNLTNLNILSLQCHAITVLPKSIGKLNKLISLNLTFNKLTSLPVEIGQLTNLTELDLRGNQLTSLPPEIGQLTNLTRLDLSFNELTSVPESIENLTKLTRLDLSCNELTRSEKQRVKRLLPNCKVKF